MSSSSEERKRNGPMPEARWRLLYQCRTCGEMPFVRMRKGKVGETWQVMCDNPDCPERACAVGASAEDATRAWNATQRQERRTVQNAVPDRDMQYAAQFAEWRRSNGLLVRRDAPEW